jgi:hypothetical protein
LLQIQPGTLEENLKGALEGLAGGIRERKTAVEATICMKINGLIGNSRNLPETVSC